MELKQPVIPCLQKLDTIAQTCYEQGLKFHLNNTNNTNSHAERPKKLRNTKMQKRKRAVYEVESILDHGRNEKGDLYFIKWKGWSLNASTWEPLSNLSGCKKLIEKYHKTRLNLQSSSVAQLTSKLKQRKLDSFLQQISKPSAETISVILKKQSQITTKPFKRVPKATVLPGVPSATPHLFIDTVTEDWLVQRQTVLQQLKAWENEINAISSDSAPIVVENDVDLEGPPENFTYTNDYKPANGIEIPNDPLIGCECNDCFEDRKSCCPSQSGSNYAYSKASKLRIPIRSPIYECNSRCKCPPECSNRVVQHGRKVKLAIFRTANGCGWGVKAMQPIKKDIFVMEYVGEVITNEEAEKRGKIYDAQGRTYLFDLDYNDSDCPFTVDAAYYGNVSHFMNHSCEPNLVVYGVWINTLDPRLPRLAFFSKRDIRSGEELTFDYLMTGDTTNEGRSVLSSDSEEDASNPGRKRMLCKCGTRSCRKYLF